MNEQEHPAFAGFEARRPGANHHWPPGSDHEHWLLPFPNNRGAEVATDRDNHDRWHVQPLRDGYPDPDYEAIRDLTDPQVVELLDTIAALPPFEAAVAPVADDADA